ncbi:MAG: putative Zn-dependent hydrolase [Candidatus Adlerbacteria bacterium]|nr:putative Zn-dependent hydrolase [Candidatus Adlerbacteria bacterium]
MVLDIDGTMLLTDPGTFSNGQNDIKNISGVLITHEHGDHFHIDSVKTILENNPEAIVVTNTSVGKLLAAEGIAFVEIGDGKATTINGVSIERHGTEHAPIYKDFGLVENTGFLINNKLFFPGDALYNPGKPVDILALPVAGPWLKLGEALDYVAAVKPRIAFPVHDAVLKPAVSQSFNRMAQKIIEDLGVQFVSLGEGEGAEF